MDKLLKELMEAEPVSGVGDLLKQTAKAVVGAAAGPVGALGKVVAGDLVKALQKLALPQGMTLDDKHLLYKSVLIPVNILARAKEALGGNMKEIWDGETTGESKEYTSVAIGNKQKPYIVFQNDSDATIKGVKRVVIYDKNLDEPAVYNVKDDKELEGLLAKERGRL